MPQVNIFKQDSLKTQFKVALTLAGVDCYRNGEPERALITFPTSYKKTDERFYQCEREACRGDLIKFDEKYWYVTSQPAERYHAFKSLIQQAEFDVIFNLSKLENRPEKYLVKMPAIVTQASDFNLRYQSNVQMTFVDSELHILVKNCSQIRPLLSAFDSRIMFAGRAYKIAGVSVVQKGLLDVTCQLDELKTNDNIDENIADCPRNWQSLIDDSIYRVRDSELLEMPEPTAVTSCDFISFKGGILTFTADKLKDRYKSFKGYKVTTYQEEYAWGFDEPITKEVSVEVSKEQVAIEKLPAKVATIFENYEQRIELRELTINE